MDIACEMTLMKNNLRAEGLSTKGIFLQDFKNISVEDEKKWFQAKKRAKTRMAELKNLFPYAFGAYSQEKYAKEFLEQHVRA
ncbi:MAG: hypothetical protein KAS12_03310 [Candidatus Aenigmarchaeota archaeon]|nr:hypothetical protein [Candidatus Aenigmarchaeota archaeon]